MMGVALGTTVAGIACVSEMKTSGVVVGGSTTKMGVVAAVGGSLVGVKFTDRLHANDTITSRHRNKNIFFMVEFLSLSIIAIMNLKLPRRWGSPILSRWIVCSCE
jgi:hypothetical protein